MGLDNAKPIKTWRAKCVQACTEIILYVEPSQYAHIASNDPNVIWIALRNVYQGHGFATCVSCRHALWCGA